MSEKTREAVFLAGVFVSMILGMIAKVLHEHLLGTQVFNWTNVLIPLTVAPLIFAGIYQQAKGSDKVLLMLFLGFQNGFFWQDIFGNLGPAQAGG